MIIKMNEVYLNRFFFILLSILPLSFLFGPAISLINVLFFDIFFLIVLFLNKETYWIKNITVKILLLLYLYLIFNSFISIEINSGLLRNFGFLRLVILFVGINYFFYKYQNFKQIFNIWSVIILIVAIDIFIEVLFGSNILGYGQNEGRVSSFFKDLVHTARRNYIGSVSLYMPTDIQINDTMVYNEDTRKIGALAEAILDGEAQMGDVLNKQVILDPAVLTLLAAGTAYAADKVGVGSSTATAITALTTYGIGDIMQTELQRSTGKILNPNELLRYQQTSLRSFTFNWTFLPDNEFESNEATDIIKMFRKAAHATKNSSTLITVPDHVVTSFHGAKDMIQLPPCYIESVNVTYNPNVSSFFKRNNAPVEIGLGITLKEIVPIYADDVEGGF